MTAEELELALERHATSKIAAVAQIDADRAGFRVERVLDQLLHHRPRPLDHLPRRNLVDQMLREFFYPAHGLACPRLTPPRCACHFASRFSASIGVRCARSRWASSIRIGSGGATAKRPSCSASRASAVRSPAASSSESNALARAITDSGKPARRATWMP